MVDARNSRCDPHEAFWSTEDHLLAMATQVAHMKVLGTRLPLSALKVFHLFWPDTEAPKDIRSLCEYLESCEDRLDEWRESEGHARANMALTFTASWYGDIDFDALSTMRTGAKIFSDAKMKKKCEERAYAITQYAHV
jgi:hypothetical protein